MFNKVSIINKSTVLSTQEVTAIAAACNLQISRDFSPAWGRTALPIVYAPIESTVPLTSAKIYIFNDADQAGALGYHTETINGIVFGKIFARTIMNYGLPVLYNNSIPNSITVSSVTSHEVLELVGNPFVDLWADGPLLEGCTEYAYELCDAVESNVYSTNVTISNPNRTTTTLKVALSNFLYPQYFDTATPNGTRMDYMGLITTPYSMSSGGYQIIRDPSGNEVAVFGANYPQILKELNGFKK